ncbi:hypothetical protein EI555_000420 [Monodon monoceros]|uniref:Uncharacterized protein n=1 Tax=Monodon monoceros TaxID=40151 RepID=A0A4U1EFQ4_MONMO|nr:hypothetical protein EI555_000420 [Monodon monoceros]
MKGSRIELRDVTPHVIKQLKRLNKVIFPVSSNDKFYKNALEVGELAKLAYFNGIARGALGMERGQSGEGGQKKPGQETDQRLANLTALLELLQTQPKSYHWTIGGKCGFYWLSSSQLVLLRPAWAMWTRGQVGFRSSLDKDVSPDKAAHPSTPSGQRENLRRRRQIRRRRLRWFRWRLR